MHCWNEEKGFMDIEETNYFFGLVEQIRGKTRILIQIHIVKKKIKLLEKYNSSFTAPVIAMVNPDQIQDRTQSQQINTRNI